METCDPAAHHHTMEQPHPLGQMEEVGWVRIRSILFATNLSSDSAAAVPYVIDLTKRFGAKLYVLDVQPPVIVGTLTPPTEVREIEKAAEHDADRKRTEIVGMFPGTDPEVLIRTESIWSNLSRVVEACNIDVLVTGTYGRSAMARLFQVFTSELISRKASCAVLTVGPRSTRNPCWRVQIANILCVADPRSKSPVRYAALVARAYHAQLTRLEVIKQAQAFAISPASECPQDLSVEGAGQPIVPKCVVEYESSARKILQVAAHLQADLIVLQARRHTGFLGLAAHLPFATAPQVISQAACPVLMVPS